MDPLAGTVLDARREQAFPVLAPGEVERLRRFGEARRYADGEAVARRPVSPASAWACC